MAASKSFTMSQITFSSTAKNKTNSMTTSVVVAVGVGVAPPEAVVDVVPPPEAPAAWR
jgi:hypothetical protein